jgi:hypothetical protein
VVGAALELLVVCGALGVAVVLGVGLVYSRRHDVVLATPYEQQRHSIFVLEVDVALLVAWGEVSCGTDPHQPARGEDMVTLVYVV